MRTPALKTLARTQARQTGFLGYDRREPAQAGAFADMKNLCPDAAPFLSVRPRYVGVPGPDNLPLEGVLAVAGTDPVYLLRDGTILAGGRGFAGWIDLGVYGPETPRQMVLLGAWAVVFPDGAYMNTQRLRQGAELVRGEDYGTIAARYTLRRGAAVFTPCTFDGAEIEVTKSDTPPASGWWLDTSGESLVLRSYSPSEGGWLAATGYVKCAMPGAAAELRAWDGVEITARLGELGELYGLDEVETLLAGSHVIQAAHRDQAGDGQGDYLILQGLLSGRVEVELTGQGNAFVTLARPMPELDFVVSCQNRLWGCRWGGGKNEILACKLGDFRNWAVFQGLASDSYVAVRGSQGPFTGAAVLGGNPLFFKENCLEKVFPSDDGAHTIRTVALEGVEPGSWRSLCVVRGELYYKSGRGICVYNGTLPRLISEPLGRVRYHSAVAAAGPDRYWVSMKTEQGDDRLFVLDLETGLWYRQGDEGFFLAWSEGGALRFTRAWNGPVLAQPLAGDSRDVDWYAETGDLGPTLAALREVTALRLRLSLELGAEARVYASYDGGPWLRKGTLVSNRRHVQKLPLHPRVCDSFRLRLEGRGGCRIEQLSWLTRKHRDL